MSKKFEAMNELMIKKLKKAEMIHLTCDMWSSKGLKHSFIGCTIHLFDIDDNTKKNFLLCLREFQGSHTAKRIIQKVLEILEEYQVRKKVRSITTDGGANMRRAILDLSAMEAIEAQLDNMDEKEDDETLLPGIDVNVEELLEEARRFDIVWIWCFCHKLQTVVLKSIQVMNFLSISSRLLIWMNNKNR